jgi:hypothetical protein
LERTPNLKLKGNAYEGKYDLNKESMIEYLNNLRKETDKNPLHNDHLPDNIKLSAKGIKKIIGYGLSQDVYKKILAHIPEITQRAVFIADQKPNKPTAPYKLYRHLACGIEIDGKPYTAHVILGENSGTWYYDHIITQIEKGRLLAGIQVTTPGHPKTSPLDTVKDTTLIGILQAPTTSKIIDPNGEPLAVFHGTGAAFDVFNNESGIGAYYFTAEKRRADTYAAMKGDRNGIVMPVFLDIKNPVELDAEDFKKDNIENYRDKYAGAVNTFSRAYAAFSPTQIKSATANAGTYGGENLSILLQTGDRDMMEEAATFDDGKDYRAYVEAFYKLPKEVEGFTDEQINAWFDEYVKDVKRAVDDPEDGDIGNLTHPLPSAPPETRFGEAPPPPRSSSASSPLFAFPEACVCG